jgi:hypothetical protein
MNRRSFFKTLAAIAAAVFAPRVAVQAKADGQSERAKAEALGAEWLASISPKIRTVGGFYIGRAEDDFVRADGALGAQWLSPETLCIHSIRTMQCSYVFDPPVGGNNCAYYISNDESNEPYMAKAVWKAGLQPQYRWQAIYHADGTETIVDLREQPDAV